MEDIDAELARVEAELAKVQAGNDLDDLVIIFCFFKKNKIEYSHA